jgi:hypothetical protein
MPALQNFKVGEVAMVKAGHGFNITNHDGAPLFSNTYRTAAEANEAHSAIKAALANAVEVTTHSVPGHP